MTHLPRINEGDRPSQLDLARYVTGELTGRSADTVASWMEENPTDAEAIRAAFDGARHQVAPFDGPAIRSVADRLATEPGGMHQGANRTGAAAWSTWARWVAPLAIAAAALFAVNLPPGPPADDAPSAILVKGGDQLLVFHREGDVLTPYDGRPLGEGDQLGFRVRGVTHNTVALLSIDGDGDITVFFGQDTPVEVTSAPLTDLPGTVALDDSTGPELFITVFDTDPSSIADSLHRTWARGGFDAVQTLVDTDPNLDSVTVERR